MKTSTDAFETAEQETVLAPCEIFHLWEVDGPEDEDRHWRFTSRDSDVTYDGETYEPAAIERSSLSFGTTLETTSMTLSVGALTEEIRDYIAQNPLTQTWVSVMRLHDGASDASTLFVGQVGTVSFKGATAEIECVGFEHYLEMKLPTQLFQASCNNTVFDSRCALSEEEFSRTSTAVTVSTSGRILTADEFDVEDGWFTYGWVEYKRQKRMIVDHEGTSITIQYAFTGVEEGASFTAFAGCDGDIATCRDKFGNVENFFGTPYIPTDNPSLDF